MIKRETLTPDEYKAKLSELRKERDNLRRRADIIAREMDELESDSKLADITIGKYVKLDRGSQAGYIEYFHVDSWVKTARGVMLYGRGYSDSSLIRKTHFSVNECLRIEWDELDKIVEISEEEFIAIFDKIVEEMRKYLMDYMNYKHPKINGIDYAEMLRNGEVRPVYAEDSLMTKW